MTRLAVEYSGPALRRLLRQVEAIEGLTPARLFAEALPQIDDAFARTQARYYAELGGRYVSTGRLRASLIDTGHPDHVAQVAGGRVRLGTRVPYAEKLDRDYSARYGPVIRLRGGAISSVVITPLQRALQRIVYEGNTA